MIDDFKPDNQLHDSKKLLLHCCCAVCAAYPFLQLKEMGYDVILYFYNPNIYPFSEDQRRLDELRKLAEKYSAKLIVEDGSYDYWLNLVKGFESEPEKGKRCEVCFKDRLEKAFLKANEIGCDFYTTTLSVSPHKNSKQIFEVAKLIDEKFDDKKLSFLEIDFKKKDGFRKTSKLADEYGFYRQEYCGCEFSIRK